MFCLACMVVFWVLFLFFVFLMELVVTILKTRFYIEICAFSLFSKIRRPGNTELVFHHGSNLWEQQATYPLEGTRWDMCFPVYTVPTTSCWLHTPLLTYIFCLAPVGIPVFEFVTSVMDSGKLMKVFRRKVMWLIYSLIHSTDIDELTNHCICLVMQCSQRWMNPCHDMGYSLVRKRWK